MAFILNQVFKKKLLNRAAGGLDVSNGGHPALQDSREFFDNPVVGLDMGNAAQLQATVH